jgi:hypothetical protein
MTISVRLRSITVIEVMREMGVEPAPDVSTAIGNRVRDEYEALYGVLPPKALRPKTNGGGSHCFAVYPVEMKPTIERVVREHGAEAARQGSLF